MVFVGVAPATAESVGGCCSADERNCFGIEFHWEGFGLDGKNMGGAGMVVGKERADMVVGSRGNMMVVGGNMAAETVGCTAGKVENLVTGSSAAGLWDLCSGQCGFWKMKAWW